LFVVLCSCQEDDGANLRQPEANGPKIITYVGKEAVARKNRVLPKLQQSGKLSNNKLRISEGSYLMRGADEDLEINYDKVMETEDSYGAKHLTYEAINDQAPETFFYNLVVTEKEGKTKIVLVTFEMDQSFAADYAVNRKMENFKGTITFTEVASDPDFPCDENPTVPIPVKPIDPNNPGGGGGGGNGNSGPIGIDHGDPNASNQLLIDIKFLALQIAVSTQENWTDVHANPRYHRIAPVLVDPSNPCGGGLEIGIVEPGIRGNPCTALKKTSTNTNNKEALEDLQTKTLENREHGYKVVKNSEGNYSTPTACDAIPLNPNKIYMPVGKNNVGAFHTHALASSTDDFPMFSDGDINYLFWVAQKHDNGVVQKDYSEYFLTLTVPQGTFAIKIKDWSKFANFRNNKDWSNSNGGLNGKLNNLRNKYKYVPSTSNNIMFQNGFLQILRDYDAGIALYEASPDLNNWSELKLAPGASYKNTIEPIKIPCN
jgi:hypothetical protein